MSVQIPRVVTRDGYPETESKERHRNSYFAYFDIFCFFAYGMPALGNAGLVAALAIEANNAGTVINLMARVVPRARVPAKARARARAREKVSLQLIRVLGRADPSSYTIRERREVEDLPPL